MIAAKSGFIADFKIGYMQRAIVEHRAEVMGGADTADGLTGFAVSRLVKLTRLADGTALIEAPANVTASSIGTATHIVAQSDDSLHNTQDSLIQVEKGLTRNRNILANTSTEQSAPTAATSTMKTISLWQITNSDDIKIIPVAPATVSVRR